MVQEWVGRPQICLLGVLSTDQGGGYGNMDVSSGECGDSS